MSADKEKVEPKTDLELGLNYSNQCIQSNLNHDSGAGANAASIVDMTFVATGRLSELVWSADKGLSIKCADSSFADKNASLFRDVGPSNMVPALPQVSICGDSTNEKPIDDVSVKPAICIASDIAGTDTLVKHPASDTGLLPECIAVEEHNTGASGNMEEMGTAERFSNLQTDLRDNLMNRLEIRICDQVNTETAEVSRMKCTKSSMNSGLENKRPFDNLSLQVDQPKPAMEQYPVPRAYTSRGIKIGRGNQAIGTDDVLCSKVDPAVEYKGWGPPGINVTSSSRIPFEKLESTAENDLRTFNCDAACGATSANLVSESNDIENKSQNLGMMRICEKSPSVVHSPSNSRIHILGNKGKEKALSEGDLNVRLSVEKEDSHESVESCNSAGLFLTGKKRSNFQQQLMVGSKRVKRQIQETSCSKSFVKQDSSFMNWISNMMKGFSQSIQDKANCLTLTLGHSDHGYQRADQNLLTYNKNQDPEPKITGFHSIFQSMYCPGIKSAGMGTSEGNNQVGEGSKGLESVDKVHGIDAPPITCCAENDSLCKQYNQSNEIEGSTWRYEAGPSSQPKIEPVNLNSHESSKIDSTENKNYCNIGVGKEKEGIPSKSSSGRQNAYNTENIESYALSESKAADNIYRKSDALRSLWITRFSAKSSAPMMISDHLNQSGRTHVHSNECSKSPGSPHFLKNVAYLNKCNLEENKEQSTDDRMLIEAKGLQTSINNDSSSGPKDNKFNNDLNSMHKLNPASPSSRFRNSEPMASMFARRLDAIKHLLPSQANVTCLFCGTRGHQLHNCSEISTNELEELLKNLNSYGGLEEPPCLCIKCFQPSHWAIACPTSFPKGQRELEVNAVVNECSSGGVQFSAGIEETARLITAEEDQLISVAGISEGVDPNAERCLNLKHKASEVITSEIVGPNASVKKQFTSSSNEDKQKENPMIFPSSFIERQISDVPKRIFDAVRKLRLSRTDILKWMNSHMMISHLQGFFLRLRLGKWEEGLGGTGYYVASINEAQRQSSQQNARISLSVNVGGIRCMVESQYISNHEFLEEEIMAWWCTTTKAGGKIPSEEDLIEKIKKKKMLGFKAFIKSG